MHYTNRTLSIKDRTPLIWAVACICLTLCSALVLPRFLLPLFDGPDGARWLAPFILWTGLSITIYYLLAVYRYQQSFTSEYFLAGALCVLFGSIVIFIGIQRFTSGLRYIETFNEIMAIRIAHGAPLYPDPEQYPVGTLYTPFFFILSGLLHRILPEGFAYGRLVSLFSYLLTAVVVYRVIRLRGGQSLSGLWASALFLATYFPLEALYDQSGVDTLHMCITAIYLYYFLKDTPRDDWAALLLCGLACFTKQAAIIPYVAMLIGIAMRRRKLWVFNSCLFWAAVAGLMIIETNGWALRYLIAFPSGHGFRHIPPEYILKHTFLLQLPLWLCAIMALSGKMNGRFKLLFAAILSSCLLGIFKAGGAIAPMFPIEPLLCIAAVEIIRKYPLLLLCQLLMGVHNPFTALYPWKTIRDVDTRITALALSSSADVWIPMETYLYSRTGKAEWDNFCALFGPMWAGNPPPQRLLRALEQRRFEYILIRGNSTDLFHYFHPKIRDLMTKNYTRKEKEGCIVYSRSELTGVTP